MFLLAFFVVIVVVFCIESQLKWERKEKKATAIDMQTVIGEDSWLQIAFQWYVDMVAASM